MEKSKKIQKNGSISIPKDMRFETGFHSGTAVDIRSDGEKIVITPHAAAYRFCASIEDIVFVDDCKLHICKACAEKIIKAVKTDD